MMNKKSYIQQTRYWWSL